MEWKYNNDRTRVELSTPPKQLLRITGHRISGVLGLNQYSTPFQCWAEITKLVKPPFEENKYIIFGRTVEPLLIKYVSERFPNVVSIEEYYGNNFDKYRWNNFIEDSHIFGGVIDAVATKNDLTTITMIVEAKTSSKPQEWMNGNVKLEYLLQGCLYAYLKGLDRVLFVCAFAQDHQYAHPETFVPDETNTTMVVKKLSDVIIEMPDGSYISFYEAIEYCEEWWKKHILTGISPEFDEVKDKEYLDIIRKSKPSNDTDLDTLCASGITLAKKIKELEVSSGLKAMSDELKVIESCIKQMLTEKNLDACGKYKLKRTTKLKFNDKKFEEENKKLYDSYCEETVTYTLSKDMKEEESNGNG